VTAPSLGIERLGRYRVMRDLAAGGMARVYLAVVDGLDKLVALKVIHPNLAQEESFVRMFLDEARIASSICHRNVCSVFDFGEQDGYYFIAMEYLAGQTLREVMLRLRGASPEERERYVGYVTYVIAEACEGLHAAHETLGHDERPLEIVHRDVSPHNLFITYDGNVSVVDFGIARAANRLQQTATGMIKGKFSYMAPEQVRQGDVDRRADVWSLGVCLWECLTRQRLFQRATQAETLMSVLADPIRPPSQIDPRLPPELDAVVMRALNRDLRERYASARELGRDLAAFCRGSELAVGPLELELWMGQLFADEITRKKRLVRLAREGAPETTAWDGTAGSFPRAHTHSGARVRGGDGASRPPHHEGQPLEARPTGAAPSWWQRPLGPRPLARLSALAALVLLLGVAVRYHLRSVQDAQRSAGVSALAASAVGAARPSAVPVAPTVQPLLLPAPQVIAAPARPSAPRPSPRAVAAEPTRARPPRVRAPEASAREERGAVQNDVGAESGHGREGGAHDEVESIALPAGVEARAHARDPSSDTAASAVAPPQPQPPAASVPAKPEPEAPRAAASGPLDAAPSIRELQVQGSLGSGVVTRMLARAMPLIRACYARAARSANFNALDPLAIRLTIDETGAVDEIEVGAHRFPSFAACTSQVLRRMRSDIKPDVGTVRVRFEVSLSSL
jgi:serine/threonine-protein kinase